MTTDANDDNATIIYERALNPQSLLVFLVLRAHRADEGRLRAGHRVGEGGTDAGATAYRPLRPEHVLLICAVVGFGDKGYSKAPHVYVHVYAHVYARFCSVRLLPGPS